jgi:hypothetical protein
MVESDGMATYNHTFDPQNKHAYHMALDIN